MGPMALLGGGVERLGDFLLRRFVHLIVEGPSVRVRVESRGWVNDHATFILPEDEANGGEKQTIDEAPRPAREDKDEMIVRLRDDLLGDILREILDGVVVIVQVPGDHGMPWADVRG